MTDQSQTTPADTSTEQTAPEGDLSGLIDQARQTPQGIVALLHGYALELAGEDGPQIAGVVLVSVDPDAQALQAHLVSGVDAPSMAAMLRAQADVLSRPLPAVPTDTSDAAGSASPWHPEDDTETTEPTA